MTNNKPNLQPATYFAICNLQSAICNLPSVARNLSYSLLFLLLSTSTFAFSLKQEHPCLSGKAEISLLTCGPGDEVYAHFGHTAIRVKEPVLGFDIVFNYGTFDFRTQGFYLKFARGSLPYQLAIQDYRYFLAEYIKDERYVYSQTLNLDSIQQQHLWELLTENYEPENRTYLYNFLYDNCTTRARDIIAQSLNNEISWTARPPRKSFWNLLDEYLEVSLWTQWGIHTILGSPANQIVNNQEQMFLPDYLMYGLDSAYHAGQPLAQPIRPLYEASSRINTTPWYLSPFFVFTICTLLIVFCINRSKKRALLKCIALPLFIVTGLLGCLLVFLGYFTLHPTTAPNFNLLWANPLNLIVAFFLPCATLPRIIRGYLYFYLCAATAGFLLWFLFTPAVVYATMPLIFLMIYLTYKLRVRTASILIHV